MSLHIRPATLDDVPEILKLKSKLPMPSGSHTASGGFLLGSTAEEYAGLISIGHLDVFCKDKEILAFCTSLPDKLLRQGEIWEKRHLVKWRDINLEEVESERIGYLDQLAALPRHESRTGAAALCLHRTIQLFKQHEHVFTTTVIRPIRNEAALPYLRRAGAVTVGEVEERYPGVGQIVSWIHHVPRQIFFERLKFFRNSGSRAAKKTMEILEAANE